MITTIINVMKEAPTSNAVVHIDGKPRAAPSTTTEIKVVPRMRVAHGREV